jgi:hypothetical protein
METLIHKRVVTIPSCSCVGNDYTLADSTRNQENQERIVVTRKCFIQRILQFLRSSVTKPALELLLEATHS